MQLRQLSVKFGMMVASVCAAAALGSVALADAAPAATDTATANSSSTVQVKGDATITTAQSSQSQAGTETAQSSTTDPSTNSTAPTPTTPANDPTASHATATTTDSLVHSITVSPADQTGITPVTTASPASATLIPAAASQSSHQLNQSQTVSPAGFTWQYFAQPGETLTSSPVAPIVVHAPVAPPAQPMPVAGALAGIQNLLAQTVVPSLSRLGLTGIAAVLFVATALAVLLVLIHLAIILTSDFVRQLRRSGFSLAPRAGLWAHLTFATPEMSFASVPSDLKQSSFLCGVRNKTINRPQIYTERG